MDPDAAPADIRSAVAAKTLTQEVLAPLLTGLIRDIRPLLRRIVAPASHPPTDMELKLLAGGATREIIEDAISLRANASLREYEIASADLFADEAPLEDVRERLRVRVNALVSRNSGQRAPAITIWNQLLDVLATQASTIDHRGLFGRDPDLLLGEICQMSDLCVTGWGITNA